MSDKIGKFDEDLSRMYVDVTKTAYYSFFFDSIFSLLESDDLIGKKHLDLGCGNGSLCQTFMNKGCISSRGVDISPDQVRLAKNLCSSDGYSFEILDIYESFDLEEQFEIVTCIYALHFASDYNILKQACLNIANHLHKKGIAVIIDITHDYVYDRSLMKQLKDLTMYEYLPGIPEGTRPRPWQTVRGKVHTPKGVLEIDHIAIHGSNLIKALKEVGFKHVERLSFVNDNDQYARLWGPEGFNHHLLFCKK